MKIISHRGYWKNEDEKNSKAAFIRSFDLGFGTETDIRDYKGDLVISHDIATDKSIKFSDFLNILSSYENKLTLALNIKADGLVVKLLEEINFASVAQHEFFVFDMSIPDMKSYLDRGDIIVYTRMSEVESQPTWLEMCDGIWLDSFQHEWYSEYELKVLIESGKKVCIVSSELHKRNASKQWDLLKKFKDEKNLTLCTDFPEEATAFFFDN